MAYQRFRCCYHCQSRTESCHSTCERYLEEVKEQAEIRKKRQEEIAVSSTLNRMEQHRRKKLTHRKGII